MTEDQIWVLWLAEHPNDMEDYAAEGESFREAIERTTAFHLWRLARQYEVTVRQVPVIGPVLFRRARRTTEALTVAQGRATGPRGDAQRESACESAWRSEGRRSTLSGDLVDITRRRA